ncbi:MAG: aldo/keto reductase [Actinomycetota bacterium]|nr:aldo/keto reductase [Actinomycetota bacterium]
MTVAPTVTLNDGVEIPQFGFGVYQIPSDEVVAPVRTAIECGYRLIDTAALYENEEGVGEAVRESGLPRGEVFVTTKVWNTDQGYDATMRAFDASMARLGLDVVDLYLIHWPTPARDLYVETWRALEKLRADGRVRSIGVSNFQPAHIQRLLDETGVVPSVNQVELHPRLPQDELRAFHAQHGIATEAWGPIGQGRGLLEESAVVEIAESVGRTPAQVVLRWHVQIGTIAIPKSSNPERIRQNLEVFDFTLDDEQMARLATLATGERLGPDPDTFNYA